MASNGPSLPVISMVGQMMLVLSSCQPAESDKDKIIGETRERVKVNSFSFCPKRPSQLEPLQSQRRMAAEIPLSPQDHEPTLPIELFRLIVNNLHPLDPEDRLALIALCSVSQAWKAEAQATLYRRIYLRQARAYILFLRAIIHRPSLGRPVQYYHFQDNPHYGSLQADIQLYDDAVQEMNSTAKSLGSASHMAQKILSASKHLASNLTSTPSKPARVDTREFHATTDRIIADLFIRATKHFPNLHYLYMPSSLAADGRRRLDKQTFTRRLVLMAPSFRLKSLYWENNHDEEDFALFLQGQTELRTLNVTGWKKAIPSHTLPKFEYLSSLTASLSGIRSLLPRGHVTTLFWVSDREDDPELTAEDLPLLVPALKQLKTLRFGWRFIRPSLGQISKYLINLRVLHLITLQVRSFSRAIV
jgi:hypothetical protein